MTDSGTSGEMRSKVPFADLPKLSEATKVATAWHGGLARNVPNRQEGAALCANAQQIRSKFAFLKIF
jgi:hypothetical protein